MSQLQPIQLEDGTTIYIETSEEIKTQLTQHREENTRSTGSASVQQTTQHVIQNFAHLQNTIKSFAEYSLNSFKQIANADVDKVTLKFGVNISGEAGIPYISKGSIGSNLEITVEKPTT